MKQLHALIDDELKAEYDFYLKNNGIKLNFHIAKLIKEFLIERGVYNYKGGGFYGEKGGQEKDN